MDNNDISKLKWLEKKCNNLNTENNDLKLKIIELEKIINEQSLPTKLYYTHIKYINDLFKDILDKGVKSGNNILLLYSPNNYEDLEIIYDKYKVNYLEWAKAIHNFNNFRQKVNIKGPIYDITEYKYIEQQKDLSKKIIDKITSLKNTLESSIWMDDLSENHSKLRQLVLNWIDKIIPLTVQLI
jgi:hypothetical protein